MEKATLQQAFRTFSPPRKKEELGIRLDELVEQYILLKITSGEIPVGTKLPATADIAAEMKLGLRVVQKALMRLSARGYLIRKPNFGTIVSGRQDTQINVFVLTGPCLREEAHRFDRRTSKLLESELISRGYNPMIYDGLNATRDTESSRGRRLVRQLNADWAQFEPRAVVEQSFVFLRVAELASRKLDALVSYRPVEEGGDVDLDYARCFSAAVDAAADRGRSNVVLVLKNRGSCLDSTYLQAFWDTARKRGVNISQIVHLPDDNTPSLKKPMTQFLSKELKKWRALPPKKRPDTLIFADDNLTQSAAMCLLREQVSVPEELLLVSFVNEDVDVPFGVPVLGVEVPISVIVKTLVDILDVRLGRVAGADLAPLRISGRILDHLGDLGKSNATIPSQSSEKAAIL